MSEEGGASRSAAPNKWKDLNPPRPYDLANPRELLRLYREARGYLHTCHYKHGTDWDGRRYAIEALDALIISSGAVVASLPSGQVPEAPHAAEITKE